MKNSGRKTRLLYLAIWCYFQCSKNDFIQTPVIAFVFADFFKLIFPKSAGSRNG